MKKIEINILSFMLIESLILLFFFKESILNIIIGSIIGLVLIFLLRNIKFNVITKISLLIISVMISLSSIYLISDYIKENIIKFYPEIIIIIILVILSIHLSIKEYHTFIKSLLLSSYLYLFLKILSLILSIPNIDISNFNIKLLDELQVNINILYIGLMITYLYLGIKYLTDYKIKVKNYLINIINPIFIKILSLVILGRTLFYLYDYPYINILKRIKYLDFIERMEGIFSLFYLISFYFFLSFSILLVVDIAKKLLKKKTVT